MSREKDLRRSVKMVVQSIVRDELADLAIDVLAVRGILMRSFVGRLKWLLFGQ